MDDAEATIAMVDSNLQREHIKPSEKAYAYKMKLEAIKQQEKKITEPMSQVGTKLLKNVGENRKPILRSDEFLAKQVGESRNQILGKKKEQIKEGIQKTRLELYGAFGCNRDNFANSLLITRKMHDKRYLRYKQKDILAHKMSISFHPKDNDKLTYKEAEKIAREFAHKFFWSKKYEVMWAVHTDTEHIHVHFIVSNCNLKDGKSFRRGMPELKEMSQFFGKQCKERRLTHSVRDTFYNEEWGEELIKTDKSEYLESVTNKKSEMTAETLKKSDRDTSFYEAFDRFQADNDVNENDEEIFYGSVFQEFNEQWQGKNQAVLEKKPEIIRQEDIDFSKLSLEERAKLLPPPTGDQMAELKEYQKRMGYDEGKMKSMKYKMTVYDEFLKEYEYRKKYCGVKDNVQKKQRDRER